MTDLEQFCDQLVKTRLGNVPAAISDFFELLALGDRTAYLLASKSTVLELWEALQRAAAGP